MSDLLSIGDFARATQLSIKTLRNYHESGLLEPAEIDAHSGYRRYALAQIPAAQVIRRFRNLDMPLGDIRAVLAASDLETRNTLIAAHLRRMEHDLARTQDAVAALRDLIERPETSIDVTHRSLPTTAAAAITDVIDLRDAADWYQGALGELRAAVSSQRIEPAGPAGGIYANDLFTDERGTATIFIPTVIPVRAVGRVEPVGIPPAELAIMVHSGTHDGVDRTYGALATYVTEHALAVDGPIREYYLVDHHDTTDASRWRTEIGWPVFATG